MRELKAELDRVRGDFMDAAGILDNEFAEVRGSQGRDYAKKVSPLGVAEARVRELEGQRYRGRQDDLDENGDLPFRAVRIAEGVGKQHGIEDTVWYGECWTLAEAIADAMADAREGPCARVRELEEAARLVAETYQQLEVRGDVAAELAAACAGKALLEVLDGPTPDQPAEAKP